MTSSQHLRPLLWTSSDSRMSCSTPSASTNIGELCHYCTTLCLHVCQVSLGTDERVQVGVQVRVLCVEGGNTVDIVLQGS